MSEPPTGRKPQLAEMSDTLESAIEKLHGIIGSLEDRLGPFVRENEPEQKDENAKVELPLPSYIGRVRSQGRRVNDGVGRLAKILDRLEI